MASFPSIQAINKAAFRASVGRLGGQQVYLVDADGTRQPIQLAKCRLGKVYVQVVQPVGPKHPPQWRGPYTWEQIIQAE